ncbi:MAG: lysophospholipase [Spirochaetales bacterium]|nr:lysophospholipase [Spirochaetales bacterium]
MKHMENTLKGFRDYNLYSQEWLPDEKPRGIVQITHGISEHSGRYIHVVDEIVPKGFAVYANDHYGHGKSDGKRCYIHRWDDFIEDAKLAKEEFNKRHPDFRGIPRFLLGHSMGSVIAFTYASLYPDDFKGLILSGFGTGSGSKASPVLVALANILSVLTPKLTINPKLGQEDSLTRDENEREKFFKDPLVSAGIITARLGSEIMKAQASIRSMAPLLKIPLLMQSGSDDSIMVGREEFDSLFTMQDKTIRIYEGLKHEVYNELIEDRKTVLNDLSRWLLAHIQ